MEHEAHRHPVLISGLIALGILARVVPHPWNATPTMAIALFAGTYLSRRWSLIMPLAIVAVSDLALGWHTTIPFTWGAFLLTGVIAWWIRRAPSASRVLGAALAGSTLFFLVTNFGVWITQDLYPRTPQGLWECYVAAIPFFRTALLGDLAYTTALFGGFALATGGAWAGRTSPSR